MAPDPKLAMFLIQVNQYIHAESMELMRIIRRSRLQMYMQILRFLFDRQHHMALCYSMGLEGVFKRKARRRLWMKKRSSHWWNVIAQTTFTNAQWKECFHMDRTTFQKLCEKVIPHMGVSNGPFVREPIANDKKVAIALYKMANGSDHRVVGEFFGVHKSSVHKCFYKFCDAMLQLKEELIHLPSADESKEIAGRIEAKYKLPQVMGVIGDTHVPILVPAQAKKEFTNKQFWASYILQAVVDDHYCFRDINCKIPGSAHPATALKKSALMSNADTLPKEPVVIDGVSVPLMILGDAAYPLLPWLMKGYAEENLTPEEESLHVHLSSACTIVDTAFVRLKARWRILAKRNEVSYLAVPEIIEACCILHNFCETEKDAVNHQWEQAVEELQRMYPQPTCLPCRQVHSSSNNIQDVLKNYLAQKFEIQQPSHMRAECTTGVSEDGNV